MHDSLGLDYDDTRSARTTTDIHVLRYDRRERRRLHHPSALRTSVATAPATLTRSNPDNPFTGNGYTSGGIPEFRTDVATTLPAGIEIWRMDSSAGQDLVAVLTEYMGTKMWMPVQ